MSYPIFIFDEEDEDATTPPLPSKRPRKNPTTPTILNLETNSTPFLVDDDDDVTVVKCTFASSGTATSSRRQDNFTGKRVISLESDSEDTTTPVRNETLNKFESIKADALGLSDTDSDDSTAWLRGPSSRSSVPNVAIGVDSDQEKEDISVEKMASPKQSTSSKSTSPSGKAVPRKRLSKDERINAAEEKKLRKEQEKLQKAALKAEEAQKRKLEKERQKWEKGKTALKSIVAQIDLQLVEGSVGAPLISLFAEKGILYRVTSNPIKRSIVWTMTLPEDVAQTSTHGPKVPYVLLVYEAEDFCNLVANERLLEENISRVRDEYPSYTVCYLTNKLMSYVNKREKEEYKNLGKSNGWERPPIDEALAKLTTHYVGVHSRHCIDEAEVAAHVVGLTSSLASCQFRKKLSWLSVNADGVVASMDSVDKHLIKKSPWLKALVAIPKVQPRYAVAVGKKYPSMKSLLKVYMNPDISVSKPSQANYGFVFLSLLFSTVLKQKISVLVLKNGNRNMVTVLFSTCLRLELKLELKLRKTKQ